VSIAWMVKALGVKTGNSTRKLVLVKLADNANDDGICWPSYKYIADQCETSKRSVINHISELESNGFLKVTHRKGVKGSGTNVYQLCFDGSEKTAPLKNKGIAGDENSAPQPSEKTAPLISADINPSENSAPRANISPPSENSAPLPSENSAPGTCHSFEPVNEPVVVPDVDLNTQVVTESVDDDNTKPSLFDMDLKPASQISTSPSVEMDFHWQPTKSFYERCKMGGVRLDALSAAEQEESLCNFRSHHESTGVSNRQPRWEHLLMGWVKRDIARKLGSALSDSAATKQDKRASVTAGVMNVADTSW
jgi:hypothetical protein